MRLLEELLAESWRSNELRPLDPDALKAITLEHDLIVRSEIPGYREALDKASRLLALVKIKKILRNVDIPRESLDSEILERIRGMIDILAAVYSGLIPLSPEGKLLVKVVEPLVMGEVLVPRGSIMLARLGEAAETLVDGRTVPILPGGMETPKKPGS